MVEGLGGAVLCTGIHLGVSVSADVRPTIELAARQERVLLTPMPCCYVIAMVIQNVCKEIRKLRNTYTP